MIKKRVFDLIFGSLLLILTFPLLSIVFLMVKIKLGSPVFFKQLRPGKDEKIFTMIKFRTMNNSTNVKGDLLPDSERLTSFGKFLRSTSLDELPELFNVILGDMSLVGPRPLLLEYLPLYNDQQRLRHLVKPGITGLAQVSGRNAISWDQKFKLDVEYVNNQSLFLDLKIILKTLVVVLSRRGVTSSDNATSSKFTGSKN